MSKEYLKRLARPPWLLVLFICGCTTAGPIYSLVVPEQRHLDVRQPEQIAAAPLPSTPAPATVSHPAPEADGKKLSLDEAIHIALANAQVIRFLAGTTVTASAQTIYDPAISNTDIDAARAAFDPTLTVNNVFSRTDLPLGVFDFTNPNLARIAGSDTTAHDLQAGVSKKNVFGGTWGVNYENTASHLRPGLFALNPQDQSSLKLSYTQPLLKGAGLGANLAPIVIARIDTERSYFQLKDSVQELVRGVIEAYWSLVAARTDVWAKRQQVEQGDYAYQRAEARKRNGLAPAAEVAQTKVALYNFKANLVGAEANQLEREDALRNILGLSPTDPPRLIPVTAPIPIRIDAKWDETIKFAQQHRPDLIELQLIIEADQQSIVQANNQALPQVDAAVAYRWNGLEGTTPGGATVSTGAGQFPDWSVGVNFSVPLGLRQGRAGLRKAELILAKDRVFLDQGLHAAIHQLAGSFRSMAQDYEQYLAFKETREAARENLEQQSAEYRIGRVIYLNLLQAISDWGNAISSEAAALTKYNTDLATLERQTGTILETHGVWFFEERFGSIGPLGRLAHPVNYPSAMAPGPNANQYPAGTEPAEKSFKLDRPDVPKGDAPQPQPEAGPLLQPPPVIKALMLPPQALADRKSD